MLTIVYNSTDTNVDDCRADCHVFLLVRVCVALWVGVDGHANACDERCGPGHEGVWYLVV